MPARSAADLDKIRCPGRTSPGENARLGLAAHAGRGARARLLDAGLDLGPAECRDLAGLARAGDEARERLVLGNLPLAIRFGSEFARRKGAADPSDSVADALLGLVKAAETFDPAGHGDAAFSTHATWKIRGACSEGRRKLTPAFGLDSGRAVFWGTGISDALREGLDATGREDQPAAWAMARRDDDGLDLDAGWMARRVEGMLGVLPAREAEVLARRFGLRGHAPQTLAEIGHAVGFSKERARQVEVEALSRLRLAAGDSAEFAAQP
jgi:RNA polymerase primary sigma factor